MILRDVRLLDGTGGVEPSSSVQYDPDDGRIEAVGDPSPRSDEPVVSLEGRTVMPGLVDAHVHFSLSGQASVEAVLDKSDAELALTEAANARRTLEGGVTSVRDMGARGLDVALRTAIERGHLPGPRTVANCRSLTITGGHGHHLGREVDGPRECRQAVREEVKRGAEFVKFMTTGGVTTPGTDPWTLAFTDEEIEALVDEAHRRGVPAATHAHGAEGVKAAIRAGVDTVEHGTFLDEEAIDLLVEREVTLVPTLSAVYRIVRNTERATEDSVEKSSKVYERHVESFRRAHEAGVDVVAGTDAGTPFNHHGTNATEIDYMVEHGMDPLEAITAMTGRAAEVIGLPEAGTIEAGNYADLLVLDDDPLEDVAAVGEPATVVKDGSVVAGRPLTAEPRPGERERS